MIDSLVSDHAIDTRTWLMVSILKSFNLKELREWETARNTLVQIVKKIRSDQGETLADGTLFDSFEESDDFGFEAIKQTLQREESQDDKNQILDFYSQICREVK